MSNRSLEDYSHVCEDGSNLNLSEHHQNKLAPLLAEREYDHNSAHYDTLPSISSRMLEAYLQEESSAPTYTYDSLHAKYSFHRPSHDLRRIHAKQGPTSVNGAVIHHNESGRLLLLPVIDQRMNQHAYIYYPQRQSSKWHDSNYDKIDPQLRPTTQDHSYQLQPASTVPTSSPPSTHPAPPSLADSPETRYTSPLNTPPPPQGNQAENPFAHPAEFAAVNSAMNPSKIAPSECPATCLCSKCCAAIVESDDGQEHSSKTELHKPTGARQKQGSRTQAQKKPRRHAPKTISKPTLPNNTRVLRAHTSPTTPSSRRPSTSQKPNASPRTTLFTTKLAAVNGVLIPSKLPPGTSPLMHQSKVKNANGKLLTLRCPRCGGRFGKRDHVRSHFVACVGRNGNPGGVRWDEGLGEGGR